MLFDECVIGNLSLYVKQNSTACKGHPFYTFDLILKSKFWQCLYFTNYLQKKFISIDFQSCSVTHFYRSLNFGGIKFCLD